MSATKTAYQPRLKHMYLSQWRAELKDELKLANINQVPRLEKIVINIGVGRAKDDKKLMEATNNTLRKITGQQPVTTAAKKSIASFKLREGNKIGVKATLRGDKMYEFADRLINIVLPRLRDFHGLPVKSFDASGNYSLGLNDQSVFPELNYEDTATVHGMQVVFVIDANSTAYNKALLKKFGMPFEKARNEVK